MAVEGEAMLWKPSASNSLWDSRRLPSLPDMGTALNRSSSFEYESSGKAQEPPPAKSGSTNGKPPIVAKQDLALGVTKGMLTSKLKSTAALMVTI